MNKGVTPWTASPRWTCGQKKQQQGRQKERKSITYSAEIADLKFQKPTIIKLQLYVDADYTHFVISDGQNKTFRETIVWKKKNNSFFFYIHGFLFNLP